MYKLLIVEDEHLIRKWLRYAVDYDALQIIVVGEAIDGQEGAKLIASKQPDIVLTDINMPVMTAFEMFESTKTVDYVKIILSGYSDFDNAREALHYGALEFLTKPIDKGELVACLKKVVERLRQAETKAKEEREAHYIHLPSLNSSLPQVVRDVVSWIKTHHKEKITAAQMAHDLGYSESYLYKIMKESLKITINDYINQYRISLAIKQLLSNPELLVYQVAEEVGFSDYRYFDRVFKKYTGMTVKRFKEIETHQPSE